jgi:hypothetical protein
MSEACGTYEKEGFAGKFRKETDHRYNVGELDGRM